MDTLRLPPGTLLAAWPGLRDPNFREGVVVLCHHNEEGSFGLLLNRPTPMTTADLLPQNETMRQVRFPIHLGGPVDHTTLHFLHTVPDEIPGGRELDERLVMGGELEDLARFLERRGLEARQHVRLFVGYSGWGPHQLEAEVGHGAWMPGKATLDLVFDDDSSKIWQTVVGNASKRLRDLGGMPPDARSN